MYGTGGPGSVDPGHYTALGVTLEPLFRYAFGKKKFGVESYQVFGPPSIKSDKYDIVAKVPQGATVEQFLLMIQNLLVDRLGLVYHWETRDAAVYDLVVAKGGSKLRTPEKAPADAAAPATEGPAMLDDKISHDKDGWPTMPPGFPGTLSADGPLGSRLVGRMQPLAALILPLKTLLGREVVDKTGLTGTYDYVLDFALPPEFQRPAPPGAPAPSSGQGELLQAASDPAAGLAAALESQLGLKLQSARGPVNVLVVDHVNKIPTGD
jgi:uncharacterized protein (TIGR03435 family)